MKMYRCLILVFSLSLLAACSTTKNIKSTAPTSDELLKFAEVNCMFWYFKGMDYDLKDIRAISGGLVEVGAYSAETYQDVALLVKGYSAYLSSKQNIDVNLQKCFGLDTDAVFLERLNSLK